MTSARAQGFVVWFTGLSCAGKTTLAARLAGYLSGLGLPAEHLDGDELRKGLSQDLGFSRADRDRHIARVAYICRLLSKNGVACAVSLISPYRAAREQARSTTGNFLEVYLKCPLEVCEGRDKKGLYRKARAGEIPNFTGVSDPYEPPLSPDLVLETDKEGEDSCLEKILRACEERGFIPKRPYTLEEEGKIKENLSSLGYLE